jgi:hypothetical protein
VAIIVKGADLLKKQLNFGFVDTDESDKKNRRSAEDWGRKDKKNKGKRR